MRQAYTRESEALPVCVGAVLLGSCLVAELEYGKSKVCHPPALDHSIATSDTCDVATEFVVLIKR